MYKSLALRKIFIGIGIPYIIEKIMNMCYNICARKNFPKNVIFKHESFYNFTPNIDFSLKTCI